MSISLKFTSQWSSASANAALGNSLSSYFPTKGYLLLIPSGSAIVWKKYVPLLDFINSDPEISNLISSIANPPEKEGGEGALLIKLKKL